MPSKKLYWETAGINFVLSGGIVGAVCARSAAVFPLVLGFALGTGICLGALWLFFKAWRAAPNKEDAVLFYVLRVLLVFGGVLCAMFVPGVNALGTIVPQLFPIPVLAVLLMLQTHKGGN